MLRLQQKSWIRVSQNLSIFGGGRIWRFSIKYNWPTFLAYERLEMYQSKTIGPLAYERIEVYQSKYNGPIFLVGPIHQAFWQNNNTSVMAQPLINKQGDIHYPVMCNICTRTSFLVKFTWSWSNVLTTSVGCLILLISNEKLGQHGNCLLPYW